MSTVIFMGTPEAAVPSLRALAAEHEVTAVFTRPDRPAGRRRRLQPTPVKEAAQELGLDLVQPANRSELVSAISGLPAPDVGVVVAFGMILPRSVLDHPRHGFLNLHFSLLPRWRGAAPVERAIMAGDTVTGATVMLMDEGLDTGPVLAEHPVDIGPEVTGGSLTARLAGDGARLLVNTVGEWIAGDATPQPQPDVGITYAERLDASDRDLSPSLPVVDAVNRVRALAPSPATRLTVEGEPHKLLAVHASTVRLAPGEWGTDGGVPVVGFSDGALAIDRIQPPGKRPMSGDAWLRGRSLPKRQD